MDQPLPTSVNIRKYINQILQEKERYHIQREINCSIVVRVSDINVKSTLFFINTVVSSRMKENCVNDLRTINSEVANVRWGRRRSALTVGVGVLLRVTKHESCNKRGLLA